VCCLGGYMDKYSSRHHPGRKGRYYNSCAHAATACISTEAESRRRRRAKHWVRLLEFQVSQTQPILASSPERELELGTRKLLKACSETCREMQVIGPLAS
jgi:hypothetical protein